MEVNPTEKSLPDHVSDKPLPLASDKDDPEDISLYSHDNAPAPLPPQPISIDTPMETPTMENAPLSIPVSIQPSLEAQMISAQQPMIPDGMINSMSVVHHMAQPLDRTDRPEPKTEQMNSPNILQSPAIVQGQQFTPEQLANLGMAQFIRQPVAPYQPYTPSTNERPCFLYAKDFGSIEAANQLRTEIIDNLKNELGVLGDAINNLSDSHTAGTPINIEEFIRTAKSALTQCATLHNKLQTNNSRNFLGSIGVEILPSRPPTQAKFNIREFLDPFDHICMSATGRRFIDLLREFPDINMLMTPPLAHALSVVPNESIDQLLFQQSMQLQNAIPMTTMGQMQNKKRPGIPISVDEAKRLKINHPLAVFPPDQPVPLHILPHTMVSHMGVQPMMGPQPLSFPSLQTPGPHMGQIPSVLSPTELEQYYNNLPVPQQNMMTSSYRETGSPPDSSTDSTSKGKKKRVLDRKTQRTRIPRDTKTLWGFDADDIKREYDLLVREGLCDKRGFKWSHIAKKIGNDAFLKLGDCGPKLKAVLRRKYPELLEEKVKVPEDPKTEWGFTADEVRNKIIELCQQEGVTPGTPHKNISLSKIGAMLGHKDVRDGKHKPFAARSDRGQLVHALLKQKYPQLAQKFERSKK